MLRKRDKKTIHFIRHAEAEHNRPPYDYRLRDPDLTDLGRQQALALGEQFPHLHHIDLIVCSPLKRTLDTALLAFGAHLAAKGRQLLALPELQELGPKPCDTGSSLPELLTAFREHPVDFSSVPFDWESKDRLWSPTEARTLSRMNRIRAWLERRPESQILVVGHAHCMQLLVRDAGPDVEADGIQQVQLGLVRLWRNAEWRSFTTEEDPAKVLRFEETRWSKKARARGENVPLLEDHDGHDDCEGEQRDPSQLKGKAKAASPDVRARGHRRTDSRWSRKSSASSSKSKKSKSANPSRSSSVEARSSNPSKPSTWPVRSPESSATGPRKILAVVGLQR